MPQFIQYYIEAFSIWISTFANAHFGSFQEMKSYLVDHLGLSKDILHIWLGILFYLCFTIIFRRNFRDKLPLILLLLLTLLGEFLDMGERLITNPQLHLVIMQDHYHDLFYTCIAPFAIFVASWIIYWRDRRRDKKLLDKKLPDKNNRQNEQS